jgi:hypothetical protein
MSDLSLPFRLQGWALVPGPAEMDRPGSSLDLHDLILHRPDAIAESILAFPGTRLLHAAEPSWWEWRARWQDGPRHIEMDMTLFENGEERWGGSALEADCTAGDVLALWSFLQSRHAGIRLHDPDCDLHTHRSFLAALAGVQNA